MNREKHLSMIRDFHLADWFTLGNAACGVGALFAVMTYLQNPDVLHVVRRGENEIAFPGCADFPNPLIRCQTR